MASRKTYFGIGWPKDAPDPDSGGTPRQEPEDRSAPTVVDDEKVAEGLRQLRSWYQGDSQNAPPEQTPQPAPAPAPEPGKFGARPTAVGHATAPPAAAAAQRPVAPDPMRATMYGHDVHRFDLDTTPVANEPPPPAPSSTALVVADPARQQQALYQPQAEAVPRPVGRSTSDPFQPVSLGQREAERLPRSGRRSGAFVPPRPTSRVPLASRIMLGIGLTALLAAVAFWYQTNNGGSDAQPASAARAQSAQPALPAQTTPALPGPAPAATPTPPPAPERPGQPSRATATPTPIPAAPVAQPKTELRLSGVPAPSRHRHREVKPVVEQPTEVDEAATPIAPPVADKEPAEPKDVKARAIEPDAKEPKDIKAPPSKETKELKDLKMPAKASSRETKSRSADTDATLPPSPSVE